MLIILFACSETPENKVSQQNKLNITNTATNQPIKSDMSKHIKEPLNKYNELKAVQSINTDDTILVALDVKQFHRFKLEKIRKKVKTKLEKNFSQKIHVSTDRKIFIEIKKIKKKLKEEQLSAKELNKKLKDLIKLASEET